MRVEIEIVNKTGRRLDVPRIGLAAKRIFGALRQLGLWPKTKYEVAVVFVGEREGAALNKRFLRKNNSSNVLSFDYGQAGEIILSLPVVRREALGRRETAFARTCRLMAHAAMHLAGWHHEGRTAKAKAFALLESKLLKRLGPNFAE